MTTELTTQDEGKIERMARVMLKSGLFGLQSVEQAMVLLYYAHDKGQTPTSIAQDFHVIEGRLSKRPEAMLRDLFASGGRVEWHTLTDELADATFSHPQGGTVRITWDMERAKRAGLLGRKGDMYSKYGRAMLRSRTVSEGCRTVCPVATDGFYSPEELAAIAAENAPPEPIKDVTPEDQTPPYLDVGVVLDHCAAIEGAADLEELKTTFKAAYAAAKAAGDFKAVEQFERKKDARKRELTAEDA